MGRQSFPALPGPCGAQAAHAAERKAAAAILVNFLR